MDKFEHPTGSSRVERGGSGGIDLQSENRSAGKSLTDANPTGFLTGYLEHRPAKSTCVKDGRSHRINCQGMDITNECTTGQTPIEFGPLSPLFCALEDPSAIGAGPSLLFNPVNVSNVVG